MKFTSFLAPQIEDYILFRKASMRWNDSYSANMRSFDAYCVKQYPNTTVLTDKMVSGWCERNPTEKRNSCRARIYCVIGFVDYLNNHHGANLTEVVPPKREPRNYVPHAYTQEKMDTFFAECDRIKISSGPISERKRKHLTIPVVFRLLYSTGMRPVEVRMLKRADVRLDNGVVGIEVSKGYDQRYVVLHDTTLALMVQYDRLISSVCPNRTHFFPGEGDSCMPARFLTDVFRRIWLNVSDAYSRPYDFRHNYAIQNINSWLNAGLSYHQKLVYLSKSMGHRDVDGTRYYYSLVPVMAEVLEQQAGASFNELIPEVHNEESI